MAIESAVNYTTDLTPIRAWLQYRQRCELLYGNSIWQKPDPTAGRNCDACTGKLRSAGTAPTDT